MKEIIVLTTFICFTFLPVINCILNGIPAQPGQFPYMAAFMIKDYNILNCGGAIVSTRLVVTTAHCICDNWSHEYYYILVGTNDLREGHRYELETSICYEYFVPEVLANDIGLVKTVHPIQFNAFIQLIALQTKNVPEGEHLVATGWGCLYKGGNDYPDNLRYDFLEMINEDKCKTIFWNALDFNFICTSTENYKGMCGGDSGSPVAYNGKLVGISFGGSDDFPDLFVKISSYIPWIMRQIYRHNRDEEGNLYNDNTIEVSYSSKYFRGLRERRRSGGKKRSYKMRWNNKL